MRHRLGYQDRHRFQHRRRPPFKYKSRPLPVHIDQDLARRDIIWAAAGTPFAVFAITPVDLLRASRGTLADLKRPS